ncbi:11016_t:CDS:2 [Ambispora leptoticha]|uniref:11016_t:CDS:1 n=1 Tax=Ambispora leptoticha TaxID=144679 RepID=A0A9N8WF22_9GLOM|nr:11016_t:CDS:2 [Ambispora leptoticha]
MFAKTFLLSSMLLATATNLVSASYSISSPGTGVVWKAGDKVQIKWTASGQVETRIDIRLVHGDAANLVYDFNLCSNVNPWDGQCSYVVDSNIASGIDYAVTAGKSPENFGYSSYFTIQARGPLPENKGCPNMGGKLCPKSLPCCSSSGYCGDSAAHCGAGCIPKYSFNGQCVIPGAQGTINTPVTNVKTKTSPVVPPRAPKCGTKVCTKSLPCCSASKKCGKSCGKGCDPTLSFAGKCVRPLRKIK